MHDGSIASLDSTWSHILLLKGEWVVLIMLRSTVFLEHSRFDLRHYRSR